MYGWIYVAWDGKGPFGYLVHFHVDDSRLYLFTHLHYTLSTSFFPTNGIWIHILENNRLNYQVLFRNHHNVKEHPQQPRLIR